MGKGTRMTKEEIIEMARQCGYKHPDAVGRCEDFAYFNLEPFAKLVAEKEREECAKLCDLAMLQNQETINEIEEDEHIAQCFIQGAMTQLVKTSKAIRARAQT